jgi:uncharacterized protein YbjT (DUF2867 family)
MAAIQNVAIVGAAGQLGAPILEALISSNKFTITVISRVGSKSTFPSGVKVVNVDYTSLSSLTSALTGQDAVISTVGTEGLLGQTLIIDAAIAAGVKRFLPSEFGSDISSPATSVLPVFGYKVAVRKHLEEKVAAGAAISYTYVINGGFLDWGLQVNFLLSTADGKPKLFDGGKNLTSLTTLASVGTAVIGILSHPEETKNRPVYVEDIQLSQSQLLEIAKKAAPEKKFEPQVVALADVEKAAYEGVAKGDFGMGTMAGFLFMSIFGGSKFGCPWPKSDNELLGVKGKTEADVEAIFKKIFAESK